MLSNKKAQGMSLNTVIIAIIVLVVLVVLVMIFTGYFGKIFTPSVKSCSSQGGECAAQCNTGDLGNTISGAECPNKDLQCCASVKTQFLQREEGVASCRTQGGTCSELKNNPSDNDCTDAAGCAKSADGIYPPGCDGTCSKVPKTCAEIDMTNLAAPGCEGRGSCCKK